MKKIVIVEDDKTLSNGVAIALKSNEYTIVQVHTLLEARKLFIEDLDLVILDINLPDGNGLDFLREVREQSTLPIILLTLEL
ncbi:MAG: response regulator [Clostridium sp.]|nr:response regulator [Clostridium sp.]